MWPPGQEWQVGENGGAPAGASVGRGQDEVSKAGWSRGDSELGRGREGPWLPHSSPVSPASPCSVLAKWLEPSDHHSNPFLRSKVTGIKGWIWQAFAKRCWSHPFSTGDLGARGECQEGQAQICTHLCGWRGLTSAGHTGKAELPLTPLQVCLGKALPGQP